MTSGAERRIFSPPKALLRAPPNQLRLRRGCPPSPSHEKLPLSNQPVADPSGARSAVTTRRAPRKVDHCRGAPATNPWGVDDMDDVILCRIGPRIANRGCAEGAPDTVASLFVPIEVMLECPDRKTTDAFSDLPGDATCTACGLRLYYRRPDIGRYPAPTLSPASGMGPPSGEFRQQHGTTPSPVMGPPGSIHQRRRR